MDTPSRIKTETRFDDYNLNLNDIVDIDNMNNMDNVQEDENYKD